MWTYRSKHYDCPVAFALDLVGGKWKRPVIWHLRDGPLRFGQLERLVGRASRKVLTQHLRDLEADGILTRKVYAQVPARVEYALTEHGRALLPLFHSIGNWGMDYLALLQPDGERQSA